MSKISEPPRIIPFDEIKKIPVEALVNDRVLQRDIHYTIQRAVRYLKFADEENPYNPNPIIGLEALNSINWHGDNFRINDKRHIYFFNEKWPTAKVPEILRPEDIVPSGLLHKLDRDEADYESMLAKLALIQEEIHLPVDFFDREVVKYLGIMAREIPFNKSLNRVRAIDGIVEMYNSVNQQWEQYSDQEFKLRILQT